MPTDDSFQEMQQALYEMGVKAVELGGELPDYISCAIEPRTGALIVYHMGEEFDTTRFTALALPGTRVVFRRGLVSGTQRDHLFQIIEELRPAFRAAGVQITFCGRSGDPSASALDVRYMPPDAPLPAELVERLEIYGPGTVRFTPGGVVPLSDVSGKRG